MPTSGCRSRVLVAEIGFLATWWVGFIAGWFMARITVPIFSRAAAIRHTACGFLIVFACALGAVISSAMCWDFSTGQIIRHGRAWHPLWESWTCRSFVRVAYIHNAGYLGGLVGLILAIIYARKQRR